jgi:flagellar biosynthetic protein FliR
MPTNPFQFDSSEVVAFVLVLVRMAGLFLTAPVFSSKNINVMVKAAWILLVTFLIFPVVDFDPNTLPAPGLAMGLAVIREVLVGLSIGMGATMILSGIQMAGQIADTQMGLGLANVIDPMTNTQVTVMGQFYYMVGILVFLSVNGHHMLIKALVDSFSVVHLGQAHFTATLGTKMMGLFSQMFFVAFRVGAPIIGALFITNMALGVVARTVPQMNVFIVGMPLNLGVGLLIAATSMSFFVYVMKGIIDGMYRDIVVLIQAMR